MMLLRQMGLVAALLGLTMSFARAQITLKEISEFAKDICTTIPITSTDQKTDLTASADAKLGGLLGKLGLGDVGGKVSADIKREATSGVLQNYLAKAIKNSNDCRLAVVNLLAGKFGITQNCRILETKTLSIVSAVSQFGEAVDAYSAVKDQQINGIGARFPGNDKSYNVGMWTRKEATKKDVKDVFERSITELHNEVGALRNVFLNIRSACASAEFGGAVSATTLPGTSTGECVSAWVYADGQADILSSEARQFLNSTRARVSAASAAMLRFPGFDASSNIAAWQANVDEFDENYAKIDKDIGNLTSSAVRLRDFAGRMKSSCIQ